MMKLFIGSLIFFAFSVLANEDALPGYIASPYKACSDVTLVSSEEYTKNKSQWDNCKTCSKKIQLVHESSFTDFRKLGQHLDYLNFAKKVAAEAIATADKSRQYADCSARCFRGHATCQHSEDPKNIVDCKVRREEVQKSMKTYSRRIRMELALADQKKSFIDVQANNAMDVNKDMLINSTLADFELATPNPVGRVPLTEWELEEARRRRDVQLKAWDKEFKDKGYKYYKSFMSNKILKSFEAHQEKFRSLIYQEAPIFSMIERPKEFKDGQEPVWTDEQMAKAFAKLSDSAAKSKKAVELSVNKGKLEFTRINGEAFAKWLSQLLPGSNDKNDLLYYTSLNPVVERVLEKDTGLCAIATTLNQRFHAREIQNVGLVIAGGFSGGPFTRVGSKGVASAFRIGRSLTGAESYALTGLALGSSFLGESFRSYNSIKKEVVSGNNDHERISDAKTNIAINLVFAPMMVPGRWHMGREIYKCLGDQMAKDLPELTALMKKANATANELLQNDIVDKWLVMKFKEAVRGKILRAKDLDLLKTEAGGRILNLLGKEIKDKSPDFFKDPRNIDFYLKAAVTSLRKIPGDPDDLSQNTRHLFLSLNMEALETWDPRARLGVMRFFEEGVEELRSVFQKDPVSYAKFSSDAQTREQVLMSSLKRAGILDEADNEAMRKCILK